MISGALDDMLPHLTAAERKTLEDYRDRLFARLNEYAARLDATVARARSAIATDDARERQTIFWMTYATPLGAPLSGYATEIWIGRRAAFEAISSSLLKNTSTNAKFDAIVSALDLPRLTFGFDGDQ